MYVLTMIDDYEWQEMLAMADNPELLKSWLEVENVRYNTNVREHLIKDYGKQVDLEWSMEPDYGESSGTEYWSAPVDNSRHYEIKYVYRVVA